MCEPTLKPCPFCGGEAVLFTLEGYGHTMDKYENYEVKCDVCHATTEYSLSRDLAIEAWNQRSNPGTCNDCKSLWINPGSSQNFGYCSEMGVMIGKDMYCSLYKKRREQ